MAIEEAVFPPVYCRTAVGNDDMARRTGQGTPTTDPANAEEWIEVAHQRAADAESMLPARGQSVGPVYMAGYAIECALKGFLARNNIARPRMGPEGHNLRRLWKASRFRLRDLSDSQGFKSFYLELWSTDLRYASRLDSDLETAQLVAGAGQLFGWIQKQIRRSRRPRS